jgi:hypothetical protein
MLFSNTKIGVLRIYSTLQLVIESNCFLQAGGGGAVIFAHIYCKATKISASLKVHKNEKFFGSYLEIFTFS